MPGAPGADNSTDVENSNGVLVSRTAGTAADLQSLRLFCGYFPPKLPATRSEVRSRLAARIRFPPTFLGPKSHPKRAPKLGLGRLPSAELPLELFPPDHKAHEPRNGHIGRRYFPDNGTLTQHDDAIANINHVVQVMPDEDTANVLPT